MENRANYGLIGAAIVLGVLCAAAFAVWLSNFQFNRSYETFEIGFTGPVRGLQQASEVRFNGIKVGEVTDLRLDPDNPTSHVLASVRVDAALPIRVDTVAQLELNPLTSVALIQLSGGTENASRLKGVGGEPPRLEGRQPQLDKLVLGGEDLLRNSNEVILAAKGFLSPENVQRLTRTLANLERASARLAAKDGVLDNANAAARNLASASASVDRLATHADGRLDQIAGETSAAIGEAREAAASFRKLSDNAGIAFEDSASATPQFTAAARELQSLAAKLETLADELDRNRAGYLAGRSRPTRMLPQ